MHTKIKVTQGFPQELTSQNKSESFTKELTVMKNDTIEWCDDSEIGIKREIKQEPPVIGCSSQSEGQVVIKDLDKDINIDTYAYSNDVENDTKTFEESLASDVYLEKRKQFLPKGVIKKKEYDSDCEIEIDENSCWVERTAEVPSYCEELQDGGNARLSTKLVPQESALNCDSFVRMDLKPKLNSSEIKETRKWRSDITETSAIEESLYSELSVQHTDGNIDSEVSTQQNEYDIYKRNATCNSTLVRRNLTNNCGNSYSYDNLHKSYKHLLNIKQHSAVHEAVNGHKCQVCERTFAQISSLKRHILNHKGLNPHKCEICGKTFTHISHLKRHTLIYEAAKQYKCEICGKSFSQVSHLKGHNRIHEGVEPHKCEICGKTFNYKSNLKKHFLIHNGVKLYKCETCGKTFSQVSNLKDHNLIHEGVKPHKCDVCERTFTQKSGLKRHFLVHDGVKPHKCKICEKSFSYKASLKYHIVTHSGVKPYKCEICEKTFTQKSSLKRHVLIHNMVKSTKCDISGK